MTDLDWPQLAAYFPLFEQEGYLTRTFRRLDPQRQEAVLRAILDEAIRRGPASLNIKRVAQRAGVSVGSLYQYFGSRDRMLDFAVELCARYTVDSFNQYLPSLTAMPLRPALEAYLGGGIEWSVTQAGLIQFFARAAYQGDPALAKRLVIPIATAMRQMVQTILEQAAARGEIRSGVDLQNTARLINALMVAAGDSQLLPYLNNYFQVFDPAIPNERTLAVLYDLILTGISVEPPSAAATDKPR
jgi:TetR/AcrR family transcriptional regulator